jgi:hypothetical protein
LASTANDSSSLGGIPASNYARIDVANTFLGSNQTMSNLTVSGTINGGSAFSVDNVGNILLGATGSATSSASFPSAHFDEVASVFNGSNAIPQLFRWQTEPVKVGTSNASGSLNLLFGANGNTAAETGLFINANGTINFAPGQTFPGTGGGTITGVTAGSGLIGGGTSGAVSLSIPPAGVTNAMLANPSLTVTAGAGLTGGGAVPLGGTTTLSLATNTCVAGSAVTAHPFTCSPFAGLGANTFTGNQAMPNLTVPGAVNSSVINSTFGNFTANSSPPAFALGGQNMGNGFGVYGSSIGGVGVSGTSGSGYAGVYGYGGSGIGVFGMTGSTSAAIAAGVFNNQASNNAGNILLGQSNGGTKFSVDSKGDVAASGNVTASGSVTIGGGTPILEHLSQTFTVSVSGVSPNNCATLPTLTLTGASDGNTIALGVPNALVAGTAGDFLEYFGWVSAANTVTIRVCNPHGGSANSPVSGSIRVDIWKH